MAVRLLILTTGPTKSTAALSALTLFSPERSAYVRCTMQGSVPFLFRTKFFPPPAGRHLSETLPRCPPTLTSDTVLPSSFYSRPFFQSFPLWPRPSTRRPVSFRFLALQTSLSLPFFTNVFYYFFEISLKIFSPYVLLRRRLGSVMNCFAQRR